jgi:20S proteasome subunit alpha 6
MTQLIEPSQTEHLPEPPASPLSNTLPSTTSTSPYEEAAIPTGPKADLKAGKTPSANRLSISYSRGNRRLVMDAEVVESLRLFREEGRIEIVMKLTKEKDDTLKGILV